MGELDDLSELKRALMRPDAATLTRQIDAYIQHYAQGGGDWPDNDSDDIYEVVTSFDDPEKALAYIALAAARTDDELLLGVMGAGLMEDILEDSSNELLQRIVSEGNRSQQFRWILNCTWEVGVGPQAWEAIKHFRANIPSKGPPPDVLPPRTSD